MKSNSSFSIPHSTFRANDSIIFVLKKGLSKARGFLLDLFFPIECLGCGQDGKWLCDDCFGKIPLNTSPECPCCKKFSVNNETHPNCRRGFPLDGVLAASIYGSPLVKKIITNLKYNYATGLVEPLVQMMMKQMQFSGIFLEENWLLAPVPLHRRRLLERGFNQSELFCRRLNDLTGLPWQAALKRQRWTPPQAELAEEDRLANVKNAFLCLDKNLVKNKKLLLVDDVFTTGATMVEGAKVLKAAGAREVWGLVAAKG